MTKDPELSGLLTQVSKAFSGTGLLSKDALYSAAKRIAKRLAAEGESAEKAFVRLFTGRNSPGLEIFKALQSAPGSASIAKKAMPSPNSSGDGDGLSLDDMVTAHMAKLPNISKGAATAAVINTPTGAAVYARERNARLTKALRGRREHPVRSAWRTGHPGPWFGAGRGRSGQPSPRSGKVTLRSFDDGPPPLAPGVERARCARRRTKTAAGTPKHGSWLNLVEGFFSKLARSVLAAWDANEATV